MSNSGLQNILDRCHATLKRVGLADGGTTAGDGAVLVRRNSDRVPCRVFVTLNAERFGEQAQVVFMGAIIDVVLADIGAQPAKGERFEIGEDTYTVDALDRKDEAIASMRCKEGR
jgi:hypothetical protein